jgi:hypothetical protein
LRAGGEQRRGKGSGEEWTGGKLEGFWWRGSMMGGRIYLHIPSLNTPLTEKQSIIS